jgi:hypothetical protein
MCFAFHFTVQLRSGNGAIVHYKACLTRLVYLKAVLALFEEFIRANAKLLIQELSGVGLRYTVTQLAMSVSDEPHGA